MRFAPFAKGILGPVIALAPIGSAAFAHHPGGVGNTQSAGPINTISASTLDRGHSVLGTTVDYISLHTLSDATLIVATEAGIEDVHGLNSIQSYALSYSYGLTNDLMLTFWLPYVRQTGIRDAHQHAPGDFEIDDHGSAAGIGDLSVLGQFRFFNDPVTRTEAAVLLGIEAPTGNTDQRSDGELLEAEFQPGSGSWDTSLGGAVTHRIGAWSFDANILYTIVTEGTQNTDLGDLFSYNAAVSYRLSGVSTLSHSTHSHPAGSGHAHTHEHGHELQGGTAVDLILELNGEWQAEQETLAVADENSGGNVVYIAPGLRLTIDQWSGFASVGVPVLTDLNGIQAEPGWRIITGALLSF